MKIVLGVLAFTALGLAAADAATLNIAGILGSHLSTGFDYNCDPRTVPEPATWGLMILGFSLLARQVRAMRKAKA